MDRWGSSRIDCLHLGEKRDGSAYGCTCRLAAIRRRVCGCGRLVCVCVLVLEKKRLCCHLRVSSPICSCTLILSHFVLSFYIMLSSFLMRSYAILRSHLVLCSPAAIVRQISVVEQDRTQSERGHQGVQLGGLYGHASGVLLHHHVRQQNGERKPSCKGRARLIRNNKNIQKHTHKHTQRSRKKRKTREGKRIERARHRDGENVGGSTCRAFHRREEG